MSKSHHDELKLPQVISNDFQEEKDFKKDPVFKYMLADPEDNDSYFLTKAIIENVIGQKINQIVAMNTELSPTNQTKKAMRTDLLFDLGNLGIANIEMQNSGYSKGHNVRFQMYHSELMLLENDRGDTRYEQQARDIHQIIFMNAVNEKWLQLVKTFTLRSKEGDEFPNSLIHIYIVQVPYVNVMEKDIEDFNDFEMFTYVLANGESDDIMDIESQVVDIMYNKRAKYNSDALLLAMEHNRQRKEAADRSMIREEAMEEGLSKGREEGEEIGIYNNQKDVTINIMKAKYPTFDEKQLENLTLEQYKAIFELVIHDGSLDEIKAIINK